MSKALSAAWAGLVWDWCGIGLLRRLFDRDGGRRGSRVGEYGEYVVMIVFCVGDMGPED